MRALRHLVAKRVPILQPFAMRATMLEGDDGSSESILDSAFALALTDRRRAGRGYDHGLFLEHRDLFETSASAIGNVTSAASSSPARMAFESVGGLPVRSSNSTSG